MDNINAAHQMMNILIDDNHPYSQPPEKPRYLVNKIAKRIDEFCTWNPEVVTPEVLKEISTQPYTVIKEKYGHLKGYPELMWALEEFFHTFSNE